LTALQTYTILRFLGRLAPIFSQFFQFIPVIIREDDSPFLFHYLETHEARHNIKNIAVILMRSQFESTNSNATINQPQKYQQRLNHNKGVL
jgi:hypothetical protein